MDARSVIFVYGTLKRGGTHHTLLRRQQFLGEARTPPGYTLYGLEGYPGMVPDEADTEGVTGEIWSVDAACLAALDELEGISEGLYRREAITLRPPHDTQPVAAYVYARGVEGRPRLGSAWPV